MTRLKEWVRREVYGARENRRLRAWLAIAGMGVYLSGLLIAWLRAYGRDDTPIPLFLVGFLTITAWVGAPLLLYVRFVRTFPATLLTGTAMVTVIGWAIVFIHTSLSSTASLALLAAIVYNFGLLVVGWLLDQIVLRYRRYGRLGRPQGGSRR